MEIPKPTQKEIREFSYELYMKFCNKFIESLRDKVDNLDYGQATGRSYIEGFKRCKEEIKNILK
jgi:hypothetical protein